MVRRASAFELLKRLGCEFSTHQAGLFIWAKIPEHYRSGYELSDALLYNASVFITPGGIFGSCGDNYIRLSLCSPVEKLETAINRITQNILPQ